MRQVLKKICRRLARQSMNLDDSSFHRSTWFRRRVASLGHSTTFVSAKWFRSRDLDCRFEYLATGDDESSPPCDKLQLFSRSHLLRSPIQVRLLNWSSEKPKKSWMHNGKRNLNWYTIRLCRRHACVTKFITLEQMKQSKGRQTPHTDVWFIQSHGFDSLQLLGYPMPVNTSIVTVFLAWFLPYII